MKYKNQKQFMNALETNDILTYLNHNAYVLFHGRNDGWVWMDVNSTFPRIVHPSFAWGIYQLMSNLNAMQQQ